MAQTYWPFDNADTTETQFELLFAEFAGSGLGNGAVPGDANLAVTSTATAQVTMAAGFALVNGYAYRNDTPIALTLAANSSGLNRIDLVVLRRDLSANTILVVVKTGTASGSPVAPIPTQTQGGLWELPIASVLVPSGVSAPTVTDLRTYTEKGIKRVRSNDTTAGTYNGQYRHHPTNGLQSWNSSLSAWLTVGRATYVQTTDPGNVPDGSIWFQVTS